MNPRPAEAARTLMLNGDGYTSSLQTHRIGS